MELDKIHRVYFIGIGGIGMSALARYFKHLGKEVSGYDRTETALTQLLEDEGMPVQYEDDLTQLPEAIDLVVYTPAIPKDHKQLNYLLSEEKQVLKRSEVLGELTKDKFTIAVAGSHGKTTVSSMIAHVLNHSGYGCTAFLGGIMLNYNSNFVSGNPDVMVIEADEFDRSFHRLNPDIAIITAVDTDHLDIYGSRENIETAFVEFTDKIKPEGKLLAYETVSMLPKVNPELTTVTYGESAAATYQLAEIEVEDHAYEFTVVHDEQRTTCHLNMGGKHNLQNATAAASIALMLGIDAEKIDAALADFSGVKRRFEYVFQDSEVTYIDDYAHHPEEIKAFIGAVRELYPRKHITAVFQPHLFSRTRDLAGEFAEALELADAILIMPIYPAREQPIEGVTAELILKEIDNDDKKLVAAEDLVVELQERELSMLLTIGAGDIDRSVPRIRQFLAKRDKTIHL